MLMSNRRIIQTIGRSNKMNILVSTMVASEGQFLDINGYKEEIRKRLILVALLLVLHDILSIYYNTRILFYIIDTLSIAITLIIWKIDNILVFDLKYRYIGYYFFIFLFALFLYPKDITEISNTLLRAPVREEIFFRFFMIGIFLKYYKLTNDSKKLFLLPLIGSNIIFMLLHGNISLLFIGIIFSTIYIKGGIVSSILAHTMYNLYLSNDYYLIKILVVIPIIFSIQEFIDLFQN